MAGTELGKAWVEVVPSARDFPGALEKVVSGAADDAGKSAGSKIAGTLKKVIAGAGIGAALKKTLDIGGALEQSFGGLDTIYGDAADKAKEYAAAAVQAGISTNSYAEQAVSFGASLKQAFEGDTAKAVEAANTAILDMTDNAAKMGTPLESIQNAYQGFAKQNYTMLDNLKLGYGGTKQEMERLLENANELNAKQGKITDYSINNLGDVYEAIHVIQDDLGLTGVAADEAAETFSGSFGAMKAAAENLMGNLMLGENVTSSMETLAKTAVTFIGGNLIPAVGRVLSGLPAAFRTAFDTLVPELTSGLKSAADTVKTRFPQMLKSALQGLLKFSGDVRAKAGEMVDAGLELIKNLASGIIKNIPTIIETVPTIISNFAGVINDNAPKVISTGLSIIKDLAKGLIKAIPLIVKNLPKIIKAIWDVFTAVNWMSLGKKALKAVGDGIKSAGQKLPEMLKNIGEKAWKALKNVDWKNLGSTVLKLIGNGISALVNFVPNLLKTIGKKAIDFFKGGSWKDVGRKVIEFIGDGISGAVSIITSAIKAMIEKIKSYFPFNIGKIFSGYVEEPTMTVTKNSDGGASAKTSWQRVYKANAMAQPYLYRKPTQFYAGDAGDEMLYGRTNLLSDIKTAVKSTKPGPAQITNYFNITGADDPEAVANAITRRLSLQMRSV